MGTHWGSEQSTGRTFFLENRKALDRCYTQGSLVLQSSEAHGREATLSLQGRPLFISVCIRLLPITLTNT